MPYFLSVGEQCPGWRSQIPDGGRFEISSKGVLLNFHHHSLSTEEIACFRDGRTQLGLLRAGKHTLFLLYRVNGLIGWSDCFYAYGMVTPELRDIPRQMETSGWGVGMVLTDSMTGVIKARRTCSVTPEFLHVLDDLVLEQRAFLPCFSWDSHCDEISAAHARWPTSCGMLGDALIIEETGCHCQSVEAVPLRH